MDEENKVYMKTVKICGMTEEKIRDTISDLLAEENLIFDITSKTGEVAIRLSAKGETHEEQKERVKRATREVKLRFGSSIFTTDPNATLGETIIQLLEEQKMTVTTVESCTGGLVSAVLTEVPGSSHVFKQGFVTYSDRAKRKVIGIKKALLKKYTAVSEQTATEMARRGAEITGSDACISVTGYAGPEGGENGEPVGLVYIGCSVKGKIKVEEFHFTGDRKSIRRQAVVEALVLLRKCILENYQI